MPLQQYTEAVDLELGAAIVMLNAELDSSLDTALQLSDPQKPNSNIKAQVANAGIAADLITTHSGTLQDIPDQL